jgi:hypothetical protein
MAHDPKARADIAALSVSECVLLLCVASGTEWQKAWVVGRTVPAMVIKGIVERGTSGHHLSLREGRDAMLALIGSDQLGSQSLLCFHRCLVS